MNDRGVIDPIDVDGRRVGDQRITLFRRLERREHPALGRGQANHPRGAVVGRKRQEVVSVDRQLRALLLRKSSVERRIDLAIAAGRRHLEANARRFEVDLRDVHVKRLGAVDPDRVGHADVGLSVCHPDLEVAEDGRVTTGPAAAERTARRKSTLLLDCRDDDPQLDGRWSDPRLAGS